MYKKYMVRVSYTGHCRGDLVYTVKAKNNEDLERVINNKYQDYLDLIDGYEYTKLTKCSFKKDKPCLFLLVGTWISVYCMKCNKEDELK